jgi:hypothetical protein
MMEPRAARQEKSRCGKPGPTLAKRPEKSLAIRAISGTSPSVDDRPENSFAIRAISGTSPSMDDRFHAGNRLLGETAF